MITAGRSFILTQKQFDLQILAALSALIGYSNNDTIIVYDRVRETTHQHPEFTLISPSTERVNETLGPYDLHLSLYFYDCICALVLRW